MLPENYEYVPDKLITKACKRQQNANLKKYGRSVSATSMVHRFYDYFVEYQSDKDIWIMRKGWREVIKKIIN